ncbi:MAG: hypothetical protein HY074_16420 [Deltaproteobacteria bacterium]|nr:hypothetical protein [Deltaproteobacteria bacterium]
MSDNKIFAFPIFAAAATLLIGGYALASDSRPILLKAAVCKPSKDIPDPVASEFLRINLFAQYYDFAKSGPGMAMVKMNPPESLNLTMEIAVPVDFTVKDGVVTMDFPTGGEESDTPISFKAADLMSTMIDPMAPPVRITVPSHQGQVELWCETAIKLPVPVAVAEQKKDEGKDPKAVPAAPSALASVLAPAPAAGVDSPSAK